MNKIIIVLLLFTSCASNPPTREYTEFEYQDQWWIGCVNGYIHGAETKDVMVDAEFLHDVIVWCNERAKFIGKHE